MYARVISTFRSKMLTYLCLTERKLLLSSFSDCTNPGLGDRAGATRETEDVFLGERPIVDRETSVSGLCESSVSRISRVTVVLNVFGPYATRRLGLRGPNRRMKRGGRRSGVLTSTNLRVWNREKLLAERGGGGGGLHRRVNEMVVGEKEEDEGSFGATRYECDGV